MSIELQDAGYSYTLAGGDDVTALMPTTVAFNQGEFAVVVGANGSGKTTLAKLLNGTLVPTTGRVRIDGREIIAGANIFAKQRVGLVWQNPQTQIVSMVVEEDVAFAPENLGVEPAEIEERVRRALDAVGLSGYARRDPGLLSAGERQRVAIAGILAMEPEYMVLDEPTSLLDPAGRAEVLQVLRVLRAAGKIGIIYITHRIEDALSADRLIMLGDGAILASGDPGRIISDERLMESASMTPPPANRLARSLAKKDVPISTDLLTAGEVARALCSLKR